MPSDQITLLAHLEQRKVGCVILQAFAGCDQRLVHELGFNVETWMLGPEPGMKKITGSRERWLQFAQECNETHRRK